MAVIYGKLSTSLIIQKESFFKENEKHLKKQKKISEIYIKQPERLACKNCDNILDDENDFIKDNIPYKLCKKCTHLNGAFEDTFEYCQAIYSNDNGKDYSENYNSETLENYKYRVCSTYIPKAEFLFNTLKNENKNPSELKYLDFGSGSGYFVSALNTLGVKNIFGSEVSKNQIELGNQMIGKDLLSLHNLEETENILKTSDVNVISFIGVLEHLQEPRKALRATLENKNVEYLYLSIPLFSLSVYIEMLSDNVFHRQLHGGHTHLYTEQSIKYLVNEFGYEIISEWWFGTDIIDLYRNLFVNIENKSTSNLLKNHYKVMMEELIDCMQLEIDKKKYSSEVHIVLKKIQK